jgi:hypothetical protein
MNNNHMANFHIWPDEIVRNYMHNGLDVLHADIDEKVIWVNNRMKKVLDIPFGIFSLNWWYILESGYKGLQVQIRFEEEYKVFRIIYRKTVNHRQSNSEEFTYRSNFIEYFDSFGYGVWDLVEECVNEQQAYGFAEEDELEFIGEDEPEEDDNIPEYLEIDDNPEEEENN